MVTNPAQAAARAHKARLDAARPTKLTAHATADIAARAAAVEPPPPPTLNPRHAATHRPMPPGFETRLCATCWKNGYQTQATLVTVTGHAACDKHADQITEQRRP